MSDNNILHFNIALVRPDKGTVVVRRIKATDRAWRQAIFGLGGGSRRIAGAKVGAVDDNPLAVIGELPEEVRPDTPVWTIRTADGLYAFAGPCAVFNDAGFGPANLGISRVRLQTIVAFNPDPATLAEGLQNTLEKRSQKP